MHNVIGINGGRTAKRVGRQLQRLVELNPPLANWPNTTIAAPICSVKKICVSTFCTWPMKSKVARATATIALCGIKFFYEHTLHQTWTTLRFVRPQREKKLPVVLSREEVRRILSLVRIPVYRTYLTTIYACRLRLLEGAHLQVPDVDGSRMLLHIHGKGKKDRYVPLPQSPLPEVSRRPDGALAR